MKTNKSENKTGRVIDANINRVKEGLRVCEEVARFILDNRSLTARLKQTRHTLDDIVKDMGGRKVFISRRETPSDVGTKLTLGQETVRRTHADIFFANMQRVKESIRVLEEFAKLSDTKTALRFKKLRYCVYETEKAAAEKIFALRHS